jgi:carbon storage regulator CsrA
MLVLSRRVGEEIVIGENFRVTVVGVENRRVKLAISAPKSVTVHREEVYQRIQSCNNLSEAEVA